jgi:hypothetical protein
MSDKKYNFYITMFWTFLIIGIFIYFEYSIISDFIHNVFLFSKGVFNNVDFTDNTWEWKSRFLYCLTVIIFKTTLLHVPSFISLKIMAYFAKVEPIYNKKIYKIMRTIFIVSFLFMLIVALYIELSIYDVI